MSLNYQLNKTDFPAGTIDLGTFVKEVADDPAITIKIVGLPAWISADVLSIDFAAALSEDEETALTARAGAHSGASSAPARPALPDGTPIVTTRPTYIDGLRFVQRSIASTVVPPGTDEGQTVSIADHQIVTEIRISGGEYQICSDGITFGDKITFAIVDKDGLIHALTGGAMGLPAVGEPGGGVYYIHKFVDGVHMAPSYRGAVSVEGEGVDVISAGFYLRMMVESNTERVDPSLPAEQAGVIGRFKVYE